MLDRKEELLNMLLVGNEIVNVILSVIMTMLFLELFGPAGLGIATGISTILLLIFGEITPKSVTTRHPETFAFLLSRYVTFFFYFLRPLVIIFTFVSRCILRIFGINTKEKKATFTEDEIKTFIDVGSEVGAIEKGEKNMMNRVMRFTDLQATDIMVPRTKIVGIVPEMHYRDIVQLSERTRYSRFPVYQDDLDNITGVLYVKDLLLYKGALSDFSVEKIMRKPLFVPGSLSMSEVQELLRENKQSFAVVIDEYSGTDGILTNEDIARQIFGELADDFQSRGRATDFRINNPDNVVIEGTSRLSDLEEDLHIKMESAINETLAGFICEKLGKIPVAGDTIEVEPYSFTVTKMDGLRVARVYCSRINRNYMQEADDDDDSVTD
ncbi:MAG: HlyC/CorC family transporter, partial [Treponema sp.]|nr:HlyC/CorC family transporter [Treponema sp.]